MKYLLLAVPLFVTYYGLSYARWCWKNGYKRGGAGTATLSLLTLGTVVYMIFFYQSYNY